MKRSRRKFFIAAFLGNFLRKGNAVGVAMSYGRCLYRRFSNSAGKANETTPASGQAGRRRLLEPLRGLWPYICRCRAMIAGALFFVTLAAATTLALPFAVRRMIDHGFNAAGRNFIDGYFVMLIIMALLLALASAMRYFFVIGAGERIVADLRRDVFRHVIGFSPAFFDINTSGEIVSRLTADITQIRSAVGTTASLALRNGILCLGAAVMMIYTSPRLSALVLAAIPLIVFPLVAFGRSVRKRSRVAQDRLAKATAFAGEIIAAARAVQSFNQQWIAADRYAALTENAHDAARSAIKARSALTGLVIGLIFSSVVAILWAGAQNVLSGDMTAGVLGQFLLYSVIAAGALGALSEVWGELSQAAGAAERLNELLAERPAIAAPSTPRSLPEPAKGSIAFRDVRFIYPTRPQSPAIKGLDFTIEPGEMVAIVGPSGAGKSTIFSLMLRFYDVDSGAVLIDGIDVRQADPAALRARMAIVPQDVTIFAASVHDNIAFGSPHATRADIESAARAARALEFIETLENGFDTRVGERGIMLSGGQRQRIAIARALLRDAPILLLDEATSALDAESETLVQKALDGLMGSRTAIVIAHRLATVLKADRILVIENGRIAEEGSHQSLIARDGLYARLARLQFAQAK